MKLQKLIGTTPVGEEISLSDELMWVDEFEWNSVKSNKDYTIAGALIIEQSKLLSGRPISLERPDNECGFSTRGVVKKLREWSEIINQRYQLTLERGERRMFTVIFDHEKPLKAEPVKGFVGKNTDDELWFCNLYFLEIE